jgi:NitT/TauT family transport system permease protein/sulfonate transport system permease protein
MNTLVDTAAPRESSSGVAAPVARAALDWFRRMGLVLGLLALWELASRAGWIGSTSFPAPSLIARVVVGQVASGSLATDVWASLSRVLAGVGIAAVLGIALGVAMASWERLARLVSPLIELVRPISVIAWIPVAIIWFGLGDHAAWFLIALGAFFPIFTNTYSGVKLIPRVYLQAARTLGLNRRLLFTQVLLPGALPAVLSGVRIGLGVGWMCVIAAEMISATSGLGYLIQTARILIETERVFAGMAVIGVIGFAMNWSMQRLGRWLMPWLASDH